jgi:copper(I)-binding protein
MKRQIYLMPLMAFALAGFTLTGCDKPAEEQAEQAAETTPVTEEGAAAPVTVTGEETATPAPAETQAAAPQVTQATAYATAEGATNGAVFLTITNPGADADKLIGVKTASAATAELHESVTDEATGTNSMRKVEAVDVAAGQSVTFGPAGYHIMLMGLTSALTEGSTFDVTLTFQNGGDVTVPVTVTAPGATASEGSAMNTDHGNHGDEAAPATEGEAAAPTDAAPADATTQAPASDAQTAE